MLALLNQTDAVLGEIDSKIDVAKNRIEQPATRCRFCGVKIVFKRQPEGVKAYNLDESSHECWRTAQRGAKA